MSIRNILKGWFGETMGAPAGLVCIAVLSSCTHGPEDKIARAKNAMQRNLAAGVTVVFEPGSERLYEPPGTMYFVCARVVVDEPAQASSESQRLIINVNKSSGDAIGFFDGVDTPQRRAQFQRVWDARCR